MKSACAGRFVPVLSPVDGCMCWVLLCDFRSHSENYCRVSDAERVVGILQPAASERGLPVRISADGETSCPSRVGPLTLYAKSGSKS